MFQKQMIWYIQINGKIQRIQIIKIDDIRIEEVTVTNFLGILIDNKLQWKEQID